MFTTVSQNPSAMPTIPKTPKSTRDRGPVFAVIEIECQGDYKPKASDSIPCEALATMPADLVCRFAAMYNADRSAKNNRRWACVGISGPMFFLGMSAIDRPTDPEAYPPGCQTGLTYEEAIAAMIAANEARLKVARVPRRWTVALRPLNIMEGTVNP